MPARTVLHLSNSTTSTGSGVGLTFISTWMAKSADAAPRLDDAGTDRQSGGEMFVAALPVAPFVEAGDRLAALLDIAAAPTPAACIPPLASRSTSGLQFALRSLQFSLEGAGLGTESL